MVIVAGIWELGWNTPIKEYDLWYYPMRDFGVDEIAMTPISGINKQGIREFDSVEQIVQHYQFPLVICDEKGSVELQEFEHPKDALYLFGKANYSPIHFFKDAKSLRIPTVLNRGLLWPHQAANIILYDRLLKHGNNYS